MIRLRNVIISFVCLFLMCGCAGSAETVERSTVSTVNTVSTTNTVSESTVQITYGSLRKMAEQSAAYVLERNWETLSSLFARGSSDSYSASALEAIFQDMHEGDWTIREIDPVMRDDRTGAIVLLEQNSEVMEYGFAVNEAMEMTVLNCALRETVADEVEEDESWREMIVTAGIGPSLTGVLTLPKETDNPPVAILMPEWISDKRDASGSNEVFRKELARQLADNGIASVRFDMRLSEDPILTKVFGFSFAEIISQDFASITHTLELYPVNAAKIIYVGHGMSGALGYGLVRAHFEITGGLVLINAPYEEDGIHLFARGAWIDEEIADEVKDAMKQETDDTQAFGGYPLSWWKEWNKMGALLYTRYVAIPILIQQAEDDEIVSLREDYEQWKSQKGSNVTMKSYKGIGHDLRDEDGVFEELIAEDIADWIDGVDINKKKTETESQSTTAATGKKS